MLFWMLLYNLTKQIEILQNWTGPDRQYGPNGSGLGEEGVQWNKKHAKMVWERFKLPHEQQLSFLAKIVLFWMLLQGLKEAINYDVFIVQHGKAQWAALLV